MKTIPKGPEALIAAIVGTNTRVRCDGEVEQEDLSTGLRKMLDMLTPREREVIQLRYAHGMIFRLIGSHYNVSAERIRHIEQKALAKLRHPTRLHLIRRFLEPGFDKDERVEVVVREVE